MLDKLVLIIDKRLESSTKYKKILERANENVFLSNNINEAFLLIEKYLPDLIILSSSISDTLIDICKEIRILTYKNRPTIIVLSKSDDLNDKLNILEAGADDYIIEPIDSQEFNARIKAHIRRYKESSLLENTFLPNSKFSLKILQRTINHANKFAAMLLDINNLQIYKDVYGELLAEKIIQTFIAIIKTVLDKDDFLGHFTEEQFLIITNPMKAEKICNFLIWAFGNVVNKFYTEEDNKRGYFIFQGDEKAGIRGNFVSTSIGVISSVYKEYKDLTTTLNSLRLIHKLAKNNINSKFIIERPEIDGKNSIETKDYNNKILIMEQDEALCFLLCSTLKMQGYAVQAQNNYENLLRDIEYFNPAIIIVDAGNVDSLEGLNQVSKIKETIEFKNIPIIVSSIVHNKEKVLNSGADLYLPKPYDIITLLFWIDKFLKAVN